MVVEIGNSLATTSINLPENSVGSFPRSGGIFIMMETVKRSSTALKTYSYWDLNKIELENRLKYILAKAFTSKRQIP